MTLKLLDSAQAMAVLLQSHDLKNLAKSMTGVSFKEDTTFGFVNFDNLHELRAKMARRYATIRHAVQCQQLDGETGALYIQMLQMMAEKCAEKTRDLMNCDGGSSLEGVLPGTLTLFDPIVTPL